MVRIKRNYIVFTLVLVAIGLSGCTGNPWHRRFESTLTEYGHRNWIVVADSAYPKQSAPGIETIATGKGQLEVLEIVLDAIADAPHVQAIVMLDGEQTVFLVGPPEPGDDHLVFLVQHVEIGELVGDLRVITAGLEEGQTIVFEGAFTLKSEIDKGTGGHEGHVH